MRMKVGQTGESAPLLQSWVGGGWLLVEATCQQLNDTVPGCADAPKEPSVLSFEDLWVGCLSAAVEETEA